MAIAQPNKPSAEPPGGESIEQLFAALESPLLGYALRTVADRAAAEDIVQEAFMRLHNHFREVREPRPWLYRTVQHLALNHRRDHAKIVPFPSPTDESPAPDPADPQPLPDEQLARWEGVGLVRLTLESLDERSRQLVHLKFHEDLSYKEISTRTGLTVGHVGYLLHHALKTIAAELARTGIVAP
jgi:RNA polymerase sigma-70 factor (ECF subfamily)